MQKYLKIIKLTLGEPDFNTPDHVKEAAKRSIDNNESPILSLKVRVHYVKQLLTSLVLNITPTTILPRKL